MIELKLIKNFPKEIIALDEVGRSPLSGPVVIGGIRLQVNDYESLITLLRSFRRNGVKDSKLLPSVSRQKILEKFKIKELDFRNKGEFVWKNCNIHYVTWEMDHTVIDSENIFQASMRGMREAAEFLSISKNEHSTILIDGQSNLRWPGESPAWEELPIIKGDVKSSLIGLAAIIAKEKRDGWMKQIHHSYPQYGFDTNFGYPTKFHREAIATHGPCPIHRKSFKLK
jgi:ribonuclease HII